MNEDSLKTSPQTPDATGGDKPTATTPKSGGEATNDNAIPEGYELIRTEDKNNILSARDRANNSNAESEAFLLELAKEREIDSFLKDNSEAYPDVSREDLMLASSPGELEELAKRTQRRFEDVVQKKLMDVQKFNAPVLSPAEKQQQLETLRQNPGKKSFADMVHLKLSR